MKQVVSFLLFAAVFVLVGCGGDTAPQAESSTPAVERAAAPQAAGNSEEVVIRPVGDQLKFETESFTVKTGTTVRLVMDNVATMAAMQHNVVILQPGADANAIGVAAIQAGADKQYVPDDTAILVYTPLAQPGERVEVEFTAPAPGEYVYICTFPGHYGVMKGIMTVTE